MTMFIHVDTTLYCVKHIGDVRMTCSGLSKTENSETVAATHPDRVQDLPTVPLVHGVRGGDNNVVHVERHSREHLLLGRQRLAVAAEEGEERGTHDGAWDEAKLPHLLVDIVTSEGKGHGGRPVVVRYCLNPF